MVIPKPDNVCIVDVILSISGFRSISKAKSDSMPGVNASYKWGDERFTITCNNKSIIALIKFDFVRLRLHQTPSKNCHNSGAARPPKPATV